MHLIYCKLNFCFGNESNSFLANLLYSYHNEKTPYFKPAGIFIFSCFFSTDFIQIQECKKL